MRNRSIFSILLLSFCSINAQTFKEDIEPIVRKSLARYDQNLENVRHAASILKHFGNAATPASDHYTKSNVGVGLVLSDTEAKSSTGKSPVLVPASFNYDNLKIGIAALRDSNTKTTNGPQATFATKYIYDFENIFDDSIMQFLVQKKVPAEGDYTKGDEEIKVSERNTTSFIRSDVDWLYVVSVDSDYKRLDRPRIILYAFRITLSGNDIFATSKDPNKIKSRSTVKEQNGKKNDPRLYHDHATANLLPYIKAVSTLKPYSGDERFLKNMNALPYELDRDNVAAHIETLTYFSDSFTLTEAHKKEFADAYGEEREIHNINHLAAHALADVYMTRQEYEQAITYFNKAQNDFRYLQSSGTRINKDYLRIQNDLAEAYHSSDDDDMAIAHLLNLLMNGQVSEKRVNEKLSEYTVSENSAQLKTDIDAIAKTIAPHETYAYTYAYTFRKQKVTFRPYFSSGSDAFTKITEGYFYGQVQREAEAATKKDAVAQTAPSASSNSDTAVDTGTGAASGKKYKVYHQKNIIQLDASLTKLAETDQFKTNDDFKARLASFKAKSKTGGLAALADALEYFYLYLYVTPDMIKNLTEAEGTGLLNIKHLSGHLLADHHIGTGDYSKAIGYLLLLESNFTLTARDSQTALKDHQRVRADLAKAYHAIASDDAALSYLLAIAIDDTYLADHANALMKTITETLDVAELKKFKEQLYESLEMPDETHYNFRMGYFNPKLKLSKAMQIDELKQKVAKTELFKRL